MSLTHSFFVSHCVTSPCEIQLLKTHDLKLNLLVKVDTSVWHYMFFILETEKSHYEQVHLTRLFLVYPLWSLTFINCILKSCLLFQVDNYCSAFCIFAFTNAYEWMFLTCVFFSFSHQVFKMLCQVQLLKGISKLCFLFQVDVILTFKNNSKSLTHRFFRVSRYGLKMLWEVWVLKLCLKILPSFPVGHYCIYTPRF